MRILRAFSVMVVVVGSVMWAGGNSWALWTLPSASSPTPYTASTVGTPGGLSVTTINGSATLSWTPPLTPAGATFGYGVSRDGGTVGGTCVGLVASTTCTDTGLLPGTTYSWRVGAIVGTQWTSQLLATVSTTVAGTPFKVIVRLPPTTYEGTQFGMSAEVRDSGGIIVSGYSGTIAFSSSDPLASLPAATTYAAADAGVKQVVATLRTAGGQTVSATDISNPGLTGMASITVYGLSLTISGSPNAKVNTAFRAPLSVVLTDATGKPVPYTQVTITAPLSGASATFAGSGCGSPAAVTTTCLVTTDSSGSATTSSLTANSTVGTYSVVAVVGSLSASVNLTNQK